MFKQNPFGHFLFLKKWLILIMGCMTHRRYRGFNQSQLVGSEVIRQLPDNNVLFVSNHQTYFADVVAMFHVFNASLSGRIDSIKNIGYLWSPKLNIYFVAAKETMKSGILPRILTHAGSISVERTWREKGVDVKRQVKMSDISNIGIALDDGWVITFPQGTTTPFKPLEKGPHTLLKITNPSLFPLLLTVSGALLTRKEFALRKRGILQMMEIKSPLEIDYNNESVDSIMEKIEYAIEQHPSFLK